MKFKYFDRYEDLTGILQNKAKCDICLIEKYCFDADLFFGEDELESICAECLGGGALKNKDIYTCDGDIGELKRQLSEINPTLSKSEIKELAKVKTDELEKTTPYLVTWQDWSWPCADGEYCKFVGYGSKELYAKLATVTSAEKLFKSSFYYSLIEDSDIDYLWDDVLPDDEVVDYKSSAKFGTLFYVFKSLKSDKTITIWDCC